MASIALSTDFLTSFAAFPKPIQGKVNNFFVKFQADPNSNGINFEKINTPYDEKIYSVRIDNTYRGIVAKVPDTDPPYMLLWVDHHDKAYEWAQNKKVKINPTTGILQMYPVIPWESMDENPREETIFGKYSDQDLMKIGVPEELVPYVKLFQDEKAFYAAKSRLPQDAYENLEYLVNDLPLEEVIKLYQSQLRLSEDEPVDSDPLKNPVAMKSFVVVDREEELRRILEEPLENWRVFLHPSQRKLITKNYNGSARVLGGAGTGKTVVAMHRAKWLLGQIPNDQQILFTTFTANLAADIRAQLKKICTAAEWKRIEVVNLDAWMMRYLKSHGINYVVYSDNLKSIWEEAIHLSGEELEFTSDFYESEWIRVVCAQNAFTREDYLKASRIGRGTGLGRTKRLQIWDVFEQYMILMKDQNQRDPEWAKYECRRLIRQSDEKLNYGAIIVDEAQDMSAQSYQLLRTIIREKQKNDIFVVGDTHQRIYKNHAVLSKCGIDVKGRSSYLQINYRTTEEIQNYAFSMLQGSSFENLDGEPYDDQTRCQSLTHGEEPKVMHFKTQGDEQAFIVDEIIKLLDSGIKPEDICITARTNKLCNSYQQYLKNLGIETYEIKPEKQDDRNFVGVRVGTMHRVKGLEFSVVFVAGVNSGLMPLSSAIDHTDAVSEEETTKAERCLLYVALTRARNHAYITSYGVPSEFFAASVIK